MNQQLPIYQSNISVLQNVAGRAFLQGLLSTPPTTTVPTAPPAVVAPYDPADHELLTVAQRADTRGDHATMVLQADAKENRIARENHAESSLKLNLFNGITEAERDAIKGPDASFMVVPLHTMIIRWTAYYSRFSISDYAALQQATRAPFNISDLDAQASTLRRELAIIAGLDNTPISEANKASILMDKITSGPLSTIMEKVASDYDRDHPSIGQGLGAAARTFDGLLQLIRTRYYTFTAEQMQEIAQAHANLATISVTGSNADIASIANTLPSHQPAKHLTPQHAPMRKDHRHKPTHASTSARPASPSRPTTTSAAASHRTPSPGKSAFYCLHHGSNPTHDTFDCIVIKRMTDAERRKFFESHK
jgi:hypothetical protein